MRPRGAKLQLEVRRRTAIALLDQGLSTTDVARRLGASSSSLSRWKQSFAEHGADGLNSKPNAGGRCRLTDEQLGQLREQLLAGARAAGCPTELWTLARVAAVIEKRFGVTYCESGVWHVLRRLGFSRQKPERQARERDEIEVKRRRAREWPRLEKGLATATATSS